MKYKVLSTKFEDLIIGNNNNIICISETSLSNDDDNPVDCGDIYPGKELTDKNMKCADIYWWYNKKQWNELNKLAQKEFRIKK